MSTYTDASLIVTPNAYKAGKLYSIKPTSGVGDLDVVRATSATRVNEQGLIEIPRTNLLLRSEEFDNASWTKTAGVVVTSNSEISPNGTLTADTINFGAGNRIVSQPTTLATGVVATGSIYVKGISGQTIQLAVGGVDVLFTLNGNWQKLEATRTSVTSVFNLNTFSGATARIISVWGAQLEVGNVATEYIPTTSVIRTRFAGITQDGGSASNIPRIDYTNGSCPSILVEPQRTNLLLRSEEFDNAYWNKAAHSTITQNSILSPSGTMTADTITPNNTLTNHWIGRTGFTLVSGTTYAFSVFAKNNGYNLVLSVGDSTVYTNCNFNLNNGTASTPLATSGANLCSPLIQNFGNGWYRCTIIFTAWTASNSLLYSVNNTNSTPSGSFGMALIAGNNVNGFYLWGAQLEAGANATSYIPTVSSTVTRNADVISKTGISDLIGQTEGTLYADCFIDTSYTISTGICGISGTGLNFIYLFKQNANILRANVFTTSQQVSLTYTFPNSNFYKIAFKYKQNQFSLFINGVKISSSNSGNVPACSDFNFYDVGLGLNPNGIYKSTCLFKTALTDQECIDLTTL